MWCNHPPEESIRLYSSMLRVYTDRRLCTLCGEVVYLGVKGDAARAVPTVARAGAATEHGMNRSHRTGRSAGH